MDLKELNGVRARRHPWETARLKAVQQILGACLFEGIKVLDVGCGDGFVARELFAHIGSKEIAAVDTSLSDELIRELEKLPGGIRYCKELPPEQDFDLLLLLDVLEHIENDRDFLANLVASRVVSGGNVLITVPAFQSLYSCHDIFLGHYRRYRLSELVAVASAGGLKIIASGYLFLSLLLPKLIMFKLLMSANESAAGVGQWCHGRFVTNLCERLLNLDNNVLLAVSRLGVKLPGLTGWILCEKPE